MFDIPMLLAKAGWPWVRGSKPPRRKHSPKADASLKPRVEILEDRYLL